MSCQSAHSATLLAGERRGFSQPEVLCSCGKRFPAFRNPVETDHWESPEWETHVKSVSSQKLD